MRVLIFLLGFLVSFDALTQPCINEFLSNNYLTILDEDGDASDWIELYNMSAINVNLNGYSLSDDLSEPDKWKFPSVTLEAHSYLLIFASGKDRTVTPVIPSVRYLHTNFKINNAGERIFFFDPTSFLIDSTESKSMPLDISYGRHADGSSNWYYLSTPTPGSSNISDISLLPDFNAVNFLPPGGMHANPTPVTLSSDDAGDAIYYTLDGSVPENDDILYSGPITVTTNQVIKARVINSVSEKGPVSANTYITGLVHEFPIICLSTNPENLWDYDSGIYVEGPNASPDEPHYGANYWQEWEKEVYIEYYNTDEEKVIDQSAGVKIFGAWSRARDQKSVALFARKQYGKGSFEYKLFPDKNIDKFESFILRNAGNDYYNSRFHDILNMKVVQNMDIDFQAYQPVVTYLNGEYWGILNMREKVNENYIASNHDVDPDEVNLVEGRGVSVIHGTNTEYLAIIDYLRNNTSLYDDAVYRWVADQVDLDNYIQYQLTQIYICNQDWPGNNIKYWNINIANSKWRWILYDTEYSYGIYNPEAYSLNALAAAIDPNGSDWPNPEYSTLFLRTMLTNLRFRNNFINQFADRINTNFLPNRIIANIDTFQSLFNYEIVEHVNTWGISYEYWLQRIDRLRAFAMARPEYARMHIEEVFNLDGQLNIVVKVSDSQHGKVKVNSIVPDIYPFSGVYFENVPIKLTAVPSPGYKFVRWQGKVNSENITIDYDMNAAAIFTAVFEEASDDDISVIINEIKYSTSAEAETGDWIEIMNNGSATVNLSNWLLSDEGPDAGFVFPSVVLAPQNYLVICRNKSNFKKYYPKISNSIDDMPFGLSNQGEVVYLYDEERNLVDIVEYDVISPWPADASSSGLPIELKSPDLDNNQGVNWIASNVFGTPGSMNSTLADTQKPGIGAKSLECFPNPFSDYTTIQFHIENEGNYRLEVFDIEGKLVNILSEGKQIPGTYYIGWFGNDINSQYLPGGIYQIRLICGDSVQSIKSIMIK